jgi:hypothetical protein
MRKILLLLACVVLNACAYTNITSQKLPAASTQQPFTSLFVFGAEIPLRDVREFEKAMGEELALMGVNTTLGTAHVAFDAGPDEVFAKAAELPVEGLLIVEQKSMDMQTTETPGYWVPATKDHSGYWMPGSTTQTFTGLFDARLYTMRAKNKPEQVWVAQIDSTTSLGGAREIMQDIGRKIPRKLAEEGLIIDGRPKK